MVAMMVVDLVVQRVGYSAHDWASLWVDVKVASLVDLTEHVMDDWSVVP